MVLLGYFDTVSCHVGLSAHACTQPSVAWYDIKTTLQNYPDGHLNITRCLKGYIIKFYNFFIWYQVL
jgi:hypothetical protein